MTDIANSEKFSRKRVIPFVILSVLFWLWFGLFVGVGANEIGFYIVVTILYFGTTTMRNLGIAFSPLYIYLILYSSLKILHKTDFFSIHNEGLYLLEKKLFGIGEGINRIIPCEFFNQNTSTILDFISGFFYITWMPFPFLFGFLLFFKGFRKVTFDFWICFLLANVIGIAGYILFPAAPPWYYLQYGAEILHNAPNEAAGLVRFDELIGFPLYQNMYSQGTNTFGAMPSMHAAFPMILSFYSMKYKNKWLTALFLLSMVSIWFAAVYSNHHYILDVIAGISCGIIGIFLTEWWVNSKFAPSWYKRALENIQTDSKQ